MAGDFDLPQQRHLMAGKLFNHVKTEPSHDKTNQVLIVLLLLQICYCFVMRETLCCLCLTIIKLV